MRRDADAHTESHTDERVENRDFRFGEWVDGMIATHQFHRRRYWVSFVEHGIGRGNRWFADGVGAHHITEVDNAGDDLVAPQQPAVGPIANEDIVIIAIIVDNTGAHLRKQRYSVLFKISELLFDQLAARRIGNCPLILLDDVDRVPQIPL